MLEKNNYALLRADLSRIHNELEKLKLRVNEGNLQFLKLTDLRRIPTQVRLELSMVN